MKLFSFGSKTKKKAGKARRPVEPPYPQDQGYTSVPEDFPAEDYAYQPAGYAQPPQPYSKPHPDAQPGYPQAPRGHAPARQYQDAQVYPPQAYAPQPYAYQREPTPEEYERDQPRNDPRYPPQHPQAPEAYEPSHQADDDPPVGEGYLSAHGIKKSYKARQVVKGVSLGVGRGESVGLLGPNGAGKTTTFYMITGLVAADEGTITIDGRNVTRLPMYRRARLGIGYLPQEASIFRGLSVEQNIMAVLELTSLKKKQRQEKLDELLEEFKITRLRKSPSMALSGGERRRCEIARALASDPSFMLLDEPFAGIDPLAVGDIQDLVRHLTRRGIGVLITDHNVRETLALVDRAYVIADGHVLTHGNPQEIISNEDVRRVYLGDMFG